MVVNHDDAFALEHGRTRLAGAIERVGRRRSGVQPTGRACDAQAGFVEAAHARPRHAFADGAIDRLQRPSLGARPSRHARPAGGCGVEQIGQEQIGQDLRDALLGNPLLRVEGDGRRPDALAILRRRGHPVGKSRAPLPPASRGQAWIKARCSVTRSRRSGRSNTCRFS
jgi:hypothetical protein